MLNEILVLATGIVLVIPLAYLAQRRRAGGSGGSRRGWSRSFPARAGWPSTATAATCGGRSFDDEPGGVPQPELVHCDDRAGYERAQR